MELEDGEFNGDWDPNLIENIEELKNQIKKNVEITFGEIIQYFSF